MFTIFFIPAIELDFNEIRVLRASRAPLLNIAQQDKGVICMVRMVSMVYILLPSSIPAPTHSQHHPYCHHDMVTQCIHANLQLKHHKNCCPLTLLIVGYSKIKDLKDKEGYQHRRCQSRNLREMELVKGSARASLWYETELLISHTHI